MKKKIIALLLTTVLVGGVTATAYDTRLDTYAKMEWRGNSRRYDVENCSLEDYNLQVSDNSIDESEVQGEDTFKFVIEKIENVLKETLCFVKDLIKEKEINDANSKEEVVEDASENTYEEASKEEIVEEPSKEVVVETPVVNNPPVVSQPSNNSTTVSQPSNNNSTTVSQSTNNQQAVVVQSDKFMAEVEQAIYSKVNEERAKAGMASLSYNYTMETYARIKSQDMGDRGYFEHKDPEGNLITVTMQQNGVSYRSWGENIAYISGVNDPQALATQFMTNWMNSSGHRANILSANFDSIGIGVYKVGNTVYATQEFYR